MQTFRKCRWIPTHGWQTTGCPLRYRFWSQHLSGSSCLRLKRGLWRLFLCEVFKFQLFTLSDTWAIVWSWLFICLHCGNIMNSPPEFTQVCAQETWTTLKHKEIVVYSKSSFAFRFCFCRFACKKCYCEHFWGKLCVACIYLSLYSWLHVTVFFWIHEKIVLLWRFFVFFCLFTLSTVFTWCFHFLSLISNVDFSLSELINSLFVRSCLWLGGWWTGNPSYVTLMIFLMWIF